MILIFLIIIYLMDNNLSHGSRVYPVFLRLYFFCNLCCAQVGRYLIDLPVQHGQIPKVCLKLEHASTI